MQVGILLQRLVARQIVAIVCKLIQRVFDLRQLPRAVVRVDSLPQILVRHRGHRTRPIIGLRN